jgi:hypothetical protein
MAGYSGLVATIYSSKHQKEYFRIPAILFQTTFSVLFSGKRTQRGRRSPLRRGMKDNIRVMKRRKRSADLGDRRLANLDTAGGGNNDPEPVGRGGCIILDPDHRLVGRDIEGRGAVGAEADFRHACI